MLRAQIEVAWSAMRASLPGFGFLSLVLAIAAWAIGSLMANTTEAIIVIAFLSTALGVAGVANLVEDIRYDLAYLRHLVDGGRDPEDWEPTPKTMALRERAARVIAANYAAKDPSR